MASWPSPRDTGLFLFSLTPATWVFHICPRGKRVCCPSLSNLQNGVGVGFWLLYGCLVKAHGERHRSRCKLPLCLPLPLVLTQVSPHLAFNNSLKISAEFFLPACMNDIQWLFFFLSLLPLPYQRWAMTYVPAFLGGSCLSFDFRLFGCPVSSVNWWI